MKALIFVILSVLSFSAFAQNPVSVYWLKSRVDGAAVTPVAGYGSLYFDYTLNKWRFCNGVTCYDLPTASGSSVWGGITGNIEDQTDLQDSLLFKRNLKTKLRQFTADHVGELPDAERIIFINAASANTYTVPSNATVAFPLYTTIWISQTGSGLTSVVEAVGVTVTPSSGSLDSPGQNTLMMLYKTGTNTWTLYNGTAILPIDLTSDVTGILPVVNGGTGLSSLTAGRIIYGNGTSPVQTSANLSYDGTSLVVGGSATPIILGLPSDSELTYTIGLNGLATAINIQGDLNLLAGTLSLGAPGVPGQVISAVGTSGSNNGENISFIANDAYAASGNGNGGSITIQSGERRVAGSGLDGDITIDPRTGKVKLLGVTQDDANTKVLTIDGSDNIEWRASSSLGGGGGTWGSITGTLSDQTDLQTALNGKQSTITFGAGVQTALGVNIGSAGAPVLFNGAGGTPSSITLTNANGTAAGLTAGTVTTNANLTGHVTSTGNAAVLGSFSSSNLSTALTDEVGTGAAVFSEPDVNTQTGSYTLVLSDKAKEVRMNVAGSNNLTVPPNSSVAFPIGSMVTISQYGAGQISVVQGAGVTIRSSAGNLLSPGQYSPMVIRKIATDEWYLWNGSVGTTAAFSVTDGIIDLTATGSPGSAVLTAMGISATITGISSVADGDMIYANGTNTFTNKNVFNTTQTSYIHMKAGTATAGTAPFGLTSGTLLTVPVAGKYEFNGAHYKTSTALNRVGSGGSIADFTADVANSGTSETDIQTYTTKASTLGSTGEKIVFDFTMNLTDITATAQIKVLFAGTTIGDTGALTVSATGAVVIRGWIIRTGASTARASVNISSPTTSTAVYTSETDLTGLTFTNTNILKTTATAAGAGGGSSDIIGKMGSIYWWPAAAN